MKYINYRNAILIYGVSNISSKIAIKKLMIVIFINELHYTQIGLMFVSFPMR